MSLPASMDSVEGLLHTMLKMSQLEEEINTLLPQVLVGILRADPAVTELSWDRAELGSRMEVIGTTALTDAARDKIRDELLRVRGTLPPSVQGRFFGESGGTFTTQGALIRRRRRLPDGDALPWYTDPATIDDNIAPMEFDDIAPIESEDAALIRYEDIASISAESEDLGLMGEDLADHDGESERGVLHEQMKEHHWLRGELARSMTRVLLAYAAQNESSFRALRWEQYTPPYNDGEPCVFGVQYVELMLPGQGEFLDQFDAREDVREHFWRAQTFLESLPGSVLRELYGFARITLTKQSITTDDQLSSV